MIKKYDLKRIKAPKEELLEGWVRQWHGMCELKECRPTEEDKIKNKIRDSKNRKHHKFDDSVISAGQFERHAFLSIMEHIDVETITMFELGAGRGDWVLTTAGAVKYQLVPTKAKKCRCLAIEGEPTHFKWTKANIEKHGIDCKCIHGAVSGKSGHCEFSTSDEPANDYGTKISDKKKTEQYAEHGRRYGPTVKVKAYTVDQLMEIHDFPHLNFIHMDVQGEECNVLRGSHNALKDNKIDYILIGTHGSQGPHCDAKNKEIKKIMKKYDYKIVVDIPPNCWGNKVPTVLGDALAECDGFMFIVSNKIN